MIQILNYTQGFFYYYYSINDQLRDTEDTKSWRKKKQKPRNKCNVAFWTILTTQSDFIICCSYNKKYSVFEYSL